jgi:FMN phosphatase YigB (HAD superfamily)
MYCNGEIKAVLFDLDDTLVNSKKAEYDAIYIITKSPQKS